MSRVHRYKDISYTLVRSQRKTLSIYIERNSSVLVRAPQNISIEEIEAIIEKKRYSIYKQLARLDELNSPRIKREFVNGESFLYLGSQYRLEIVRNQEVPLKLYRGYFYLREKDIPRGYDVFKAFYREKGREKLEQRVTFYNDAMGVNPQGIRVMDLRHRWASCSKNSILNFHWKCVMAPLRIIDYIVVHEMAHLLHRHHTQAFYEMIDKVLPDYMERKNWLTRFGASMDIR
jgi:predicted metal-dependent hydrolase